MTEVVKQTVQTVTVTIPALESLSDAADMPNGVAAAVIMPIDFTPANLTFLISADGVLFVDLFDQYGNEVMAACRPSTAVRVKDAIGSALQMKIRSGTRDHPVPQEADRTFTIILA